jgi:hypothetical protein
MMTLLPVTLMLGVRQDVQALSRLADGPPLRPNAPAAEWYSRKDKLCLIFDVADIVTVMDVAPADEEST